MRRFLFAAFFAALLFSSPLYAQCADPDGSASQTRYDFDANMMLYCNGTEWTQFGVLPVGCLENQLPAWDGTKWICKSPSGANYTGALVSGSKTGSNCTLAGGTPYEISSGSYVCYFAGNMLASHNCPAGWSNYLNWTITTNTTCADSNCSSYGSSHACTTSSHATFANTARETCSHRKYNQGACPFGTCTANVTARGCV